MRCFVKQPTTRTCYVVGMLTGRELQTKRQPVCACVTQAFIRDPTYTRRTRTMPVCALATQVEEVPTAAQVQAVLTYLRSLGLSDAELFKVIKGRYASAHSTRMLSQHVAGYTCAPQPQTT